VTMTPEKSLRLKGRMSHVAGILILVLAVLAAAYAVHCCLERRHSRNLKDCSNNLMQIGEAISIYESRHQAYPPGTSTDFFDNLRKGVPDVAREDLFVCKAWGRSDPGPGITNYRGPAQPIDGKTPPTRPLAGDKTTNHRQNEAILVLYMDGHVGIVSPGTFEWTEAEKWLK
jgi:hypothetical protein